MNTWQTLVTIAGMALITLVTRAFFLIPEREIPLPDWLRQGLRYAPLAAMAAVVIPELVMSNGQLIATWKDARLFGAAVGAGWYFWRRGILGTIVSGTVVLVILRLGMGW
jgi:branched-subunit amino acid transport protein